MSPRLSICVTTYNRANWLPDSLSTILSQSYSDFELIVVDNASTDNTQDVVRSIRDPRLRYVRNEVNCGLLRNQNRAIQEAKGDLISIYHDDDFYHPDIVKRSIDILDKNPRVGVVCSAVHLVEPDNPDQVRLTDIRDWKPIMPGHLMRRELLHRWDSRIPAPTTMVRRACYNEHGVFKPEFGGGADRELWLRIMRTWNLAYIREPMARLRLKRHLRQYTAEQAAQCWFDLRGQVQIQKVHLEEDCKDAPVRRFIERQRLRITRFKEFWRWGIWAIAKGNNDEFLEAAVTAFHQEGLHSSARILARLYRSKIAHRTAAHAVQLYRQVAA